MSQPVVTTLTQYVLTAAAVANGAIRIAARRGATTSDTMRRAAWCDERRSVTKTARCDERCGAVRRVARRDAAAIT